MKKAELRTAFKKRRSELTDEQISSLDILIFDELKAFDWTAIGYLHCYLAIPKFKEYDTMKFIQWIWEMHPHIQIVISKSDFESHQLRHFVFDKQTILESNAWGIPEPIGAVEIDVNTIDAVLAPLLVVDKQGNRVGYGKGFYDRFFASCKDTVLRTGISYFEPVDSIVDIKAWDVPIVVVFTPGKTYCF